MATSDRVREDVKLTVRMKHDGDALVVRGFGELNLSNAQTLEAELRRALDGESPAVILDLTSVTVIDSKALSGLLSMANQSLRNGGRLRLVRGSADKRAIDQDRLGRTPSVDSAASGPRKGAVVKLSKAGGLTLVDVEGALEAPGVERWNGLLDSAIVDGATGLAVDLRGCPAIDFGCVSVLLAASGKLKARGDNGINVVTTPGSPLHRTLEAAAAKELPAYSSAGEALRSLRDVQ